MLQTMLLWLKDALNNTSGIASNSNGFKGIISWKEAFLSLNIGQIYLNGQLCSIDKANWLKRWWKGNIENIIFIIKQIEEYIDISKASIDRKEFYFSLLRSYLWVSELKIIQEVLKDMDYTLKTCKQ